MNATKKIFIFISFITIIYFVYYNFPNAVNFLKIRPILKTHLLNKFDTQGCQLKLEPNHFICPKYNRQNKLLVFIYVLVSVDNFKNRQAIRNTWANLTANDLTSSYRVIFCVGLSKDQDVNKKLIKENQIYNDILQGDFNDSYQVLINKSLMVFKWISTHCSHARFILKIDHDVVLNINGLVEFLNNYINNITNKNKISNVLIGNIFQKSSPIRDFKSKWFVSFEKYNKTFYDPFPSGPAYLFSFDLSQSMYEKSSTFKSPVSMEDVYVGMLAKQLNSYLYNIAFAYIPRDHYGRHSFQQKITQISQNKINETLFVYAKENEYHKLWEFIKKNYYFNSNKLTKS